MVPPAHLANVGARWARNSMQAVPTMDHIDAVPASESDSSIFTECVLDFSKYLNSGDLPASPQQFFEDLFDEEKAGLNKQLPGSVKIKEEPDSTATSRCSTPESLLPEHDFDKGDFPSPQFQPSSGVISHPTSTAASENRSSLMCQLQSIQSSANTTDMDSCDSDSDSDTRSLSLNAQRLKSALAQLEVRPEDASSSVESLSSLVKLEDGQKPHSLKSPRSKPRKQLEKGSAEYVLKRERNNVAVRKSRTKAKLKHIETQMRVGELTEENNQLRNRVSMLQKELNALKAFIAYNCPPNRKPPSYASYPPVYSSVPKII